MNKTAATLMLGLLILLPVRITGAVCNECHSKNPKMVRMHEALGFRDCFKCHDFGKKISTEQRMLQKESDALCTRCHLK